MKCSIHGSFHSSSSCPSRPASRPLLYSHRKAAKKRNKLMAMASLHGESSTGDSDSLRRRAVLFVGISVFPFLQLKAVALEGRGMLRRGGVRTLSESRRKPGDVENKQDAVKLEADIPKQPEQETSPQVDQSVQQAEQNILPKESNEPKQVNAQDAPKTLKKPEAEVLEESKIVTLSQEPTQTKLADQEVTPGNPLVPFLNELGIIGSGVLGALYATSRKEKSAMESTIESMKTKQNEQEVAMTKLKEVFHARLLGEQEERKRQVNNLKQEEASRLKPLGLQVMKE
ncbi:hypothetical protein J5N97_000585 [Dioscorea zingiberensis]|uniref:Uncharacterized protein n=1 Tax=Dioscorea zingiberensis TaxID=325984 RepID=A0A9D5BS51_9LILI|nr:hypothetical protein J5N97_000585 [Dioscorea zingiberensis]